jgi:hypothetical protein
MTTALFCNNEPENTSHLFWDCEHVNQFWQNFNQYLIDKMGRDHVDLDINMVFYGVSECDRSHMALYNTLIFNGKRYIYECRFNEKKPEFNRFVYKIGYIKNIEFEVAKANNTTIKWQDKWSPLV